MRDEDAKLVAAIGAGDRSAFAKFYDKYANLLYSIALHILNDPSEAEDVLQEISLQIWEKAPQFAPQLGKASSWAAILARNRAIDHLRASQRRSRLVEGATAKESTSAPAIETANDIVHGLEKAKLIKSALAELPKEERKAIELAFFSGLTQSEISENLREPLGTIKARIRRGMLKLRDQLEGRL